MTTNDEVLIIASKIEKLWRQANNAGATPAEREAFEAKALALMEEHRITMAMLEIDQTDVLGDHHYGFIQGRYVKVEIQVISAITWAYDCRMWWRNWSGGRRDVFIFGFRTDAERVIAMSKMLLADAYAQAARERGYSAGDTYSRRHSFIAGYATALSERLREAARLAGKATEDRDAEAAHSAALVLVSRREQMATEFASRHAGLRTDSPASVRGGSSYRRGQEAARNASLHTQAKVAPRRALTSCT